MKKIYFITINFIVLLLINNTYLSKAQDVPMLRIKATLVNANAVADETVIYFHNDATINYDPVYDGKKKLNTDPNIPNIYSMTPDNDSLVINGMPELTDFYLPIILDIAKEGEIQINAYQIINFTSGFNIIMEDAYNNVTIDLLKNPLFNCIVKPGETNRFFIHFKNSQNLATSIEDINNNLSFIKVNNNQININSIDNIKSVFISDLNGRIIFQKNNLSANININNLKRGFYFVNILTDKTSYNKKISIF